MTVQEAKEILEYYEKQEWFFEKDQPAKNAFTMAIESMKELEQYRALEEQGLLVKFKPTELELLIIAMEVYKDDYPISAMLNQVAYEEFYSLLDRLYEAEAKLKEMEGE